MGILDSGFGHIIFLNAGAPFSIKLNQKESPILW
jgi:hypothetical protein